MDEDCADDWLEELVDISEDTPSLDDATKEDDDEIDEAGTEDASTEEDIDDKGARDEDAPPEEEPEPPHPPNIRALTITQGNMFGSLSIRVSNNNFMSPDPGVGLGISGMLPNLNWGICAQD